MNQQLKKYSASDTLPISSGILLGSSANVQGRRWTFSWDFKSRISSAYWIKGNQAQLEAAEFNHIFCFRSPSIIRGLWSTFCKIYGFNTGWINSEGRGFRDVECGNNHGSALGQYSSWYEAYWASVRPLFCSDQHNHLHRQARTPWSLINSPEIRLYRVPMTLELGFR